MAYIPNLSLNIDALTGVLIPGPFSSGMTTLDLTRGDLVKAEVLVFARKTGANNQGVIQTDMALLDPEPGQQFRIGIFDKEAGTTLVFSDAFSSNPIVLPLTPVEVTPWNGTYSVWRFPFSGGSYGYGTANYRFDGASTFNFSISGTGTLNASTTNDLNNQLNNIANDYNGWNITYPAYRNVVSAGKSPAKAVYFVDQNGVFGWEVTTYFDFGVGEYVSSSGPNGGPLMSNQRGWFGSFDLNTNEVETWLGEDFNKVAVIEAEITEPGGEKRTILQQDVTIHRDYINNDSPTNPIPSPDYCQTINSLSDVASAPDARDNLDVYSKGETDAAIAAGSGGGTYLPLAGGTMTGAVVFDAVGAQNINKGTFDNSTGGYNGISLTCAVGYELNWQGGHLVSMYASSAQSLIIDSPLSISHAGGITFSDASVQTTAGLTIAGGTLTANSTLLLSDATYDSEVGGWGFGVELTSDAVQSASIQFNQVRVQNSAGGTNITPTGITFPDSTTLSTAPVAGVTYRQTIALAVTAGGGNASYWSGVNYVTGFYYPSGGTIANDWTVANKFKVQINGYLFGFSYVSNGCMYVNGMDDTMTYSATGTGETLYLHYDGETAPYPFLIT